MNAKAENNIFDLFARRNPSPHDRSGSNGKRPYRAYEFDEAAEGKGQEEWFRVHGHVDELPDSIEVCRYLDILKVYSTVHQLLTIICDDVAFDLEGQFLDAIPALIQDRRLRALHCFDPERHIEPGPDEPVIRSIQRESMAVVGPKDAPEPVETP